VHHVLRYGNPRMHCVSNTWRNCLWGKGMSVGLTSSRHVTMGFLYNQSAFHSLTHLTVFGKKARTHHHFSYMLLKSVYHSLMCRHYTQCNWRTILPAIASFQRVSTSAICCAQCCRSKITMYFNKLVHNNITEQLPAILRSMLHRVSDTSKLTILTIVRHHSTL